MKTESKLRILSLELRIMRYEITNEEKKNIRDFYKTIREIPDEPIWPKKVVHVERVV